MAKKIRLAEIMRIRAFIRQTGKDDEEASIARLSKRDKLIKLYAKVKEPEDSWTTEELALGFSLNQEPPKKGEEWIPTHKAYTQMYNTIYRARQYLIENEGHPNYSVLTQLSGLDGWQKVQVPSSSIQQIERAQVKIKKMIDGESA